MARNQNVLTDDFSFLGSSSVDGKIIRYLGRGGNAELRLNVISDCIDKIVNVLSQAQELVNYKDYEFRLSISAELRDRNCTLKLFQRVENRNEMIIGRTDTRGSDRPNLNFVREITLSVNVSNAIKDALYEAVEDLLLKWSNSLKPQSSNDMMQRAQDHKLRSTQGVIIKNLEELLTLYACAMKRSRKIEVAHILFNGNYTYAGICYVLSLLMSESNYNSLGNLEMTSLVTTRRGMINEEKIIRYKLSCALPFTFVTLNKSLKLRINVMQSKVSTPIVQNVIDYSDAESVRVGAYKKSQKTNEARRDFRVDVIDTSPKRSSFKLELSSTAIPEERCDTTKELKDNESGISASTPTRSGRTNVSGFMSQLNTPVRAEQIDLIDKRLCELMTRPEILTFQLAVKNGLISKREIIREHLESDSGRKIANIKKLFIVLDSLMSTQSDIKGIMCEVLGDSIDKLLATLYAHSCDDETRNKILRGVFYLQCLVYDIKPNVINILMCLDGGAWLELQDLIKSFLI